MTHALDTAGHISEICKRVGLKFIYKSSFDKANRSSISTQRGLGIDQGLQILNAVKHQLGVPVLTDIHESYQAELCATAGIDVLQIPAFLCRQTDLLLAAGETGCAINVKKGQFLAPHSVQQPGAFGSSSGGDRRMVPPLARAAVATGSVAAVFMECHEDPDRAPSDGPNMIPLSQLESIITQLKQIHQLTQNYE